MIVKFLVVGYKQGKTKMVDYVDGTILWYHKSNKPVTMSFSGNTLFVTLEKEPKIDETSDSEYVHIR